MTGSPLREVFNRHGAGLESSTVLEQLGLEQGKYFVVSAHREENVDAPERLQALVDALERLASDYGWPVVVNLILGTARQHHAWSNLKLAPGSSRDR